MARVGGGRTWRWLAQHRLAVQVAIDSIAWVVARALMGGARYAWRLFLERRRLPKSENCERFLVLGAGDGGAQVITAMLRDPTSPYLPVALLDDDPANANLRIRGVPVVGTRR